MAELIWFVLLSPLIGVFINGLVLSGMGRETRQKLCGIVGSLAAGIAFVCALLVAVNLSQILAGRPWLDLIRYTWIEIPGSLSIPMAVRIDPLSITMTLVVTGVGTLIHIFSMGYMKGDERYGRFFTYLNLFLFSMLILVLANNFVLMFVGWEGVGVCSYLLIGFWFERVSAAQAGKKAFLVNRVGDFAFLLGLFVIFWVTGSLVYNTPAGTGAFDQAARMMEVRIGPLSALEVACLLLFVGACGKSAQIPLYVWLPDAMEGPTPVSALIHAATMVTAGVYLVARSAVMFGQTELAHTVVAWIGVLTALYAAIIAIKQYDIKRVLAYSTVSQLGYMFVGVGVGAYAAGISHLVTHAFFKALMFLGAGAVMHALEGQLDMRKMGNMKKHMPVTFFTFAIGWYMICGLPFGSGFFSKDAILENALHHGQPAIFGIGVFVAGLTAFYMTRMFVTVFFGSERIELGDEGHGGDQQEHGHSHEHSHGHGHDHGHGHGHGHGHVHVHPEQWVMNFPLIALAFLSIAGSLVVFFLPGFIHDVTQGMVDTARGAAAGAHGAAEAAHGGAGAHGAEAAHGAVRPGVWSWPTWAMLTGMPTLVSSAAAIIGVLAAWVGFGPEKFARGWPAGVERGLGATQNAYEGFLHLVVVRGGTAISQVLYSIVDRLMIDKLVDGVGSFVNYLAESLRTLQTGYVRNYALVMLAGAVFVVACFLIILQQPFK